MSLSIWQSVYLRIFVATLTLAVVFTMVFYAYCLDNFSSFGVTLVTKNSTINYEKPQETKKPIIILIWMWPFGNRFDLNCAQYNITGCLLTDDKSVYSAADAVMFHHRDIGFDLKGFPKYPRPRFQKWVWWNMESPTHTATIPSLNDLFNLTCSYRRDSDIFTPYGNLVPISEEDSPFPHFPLKERLVCWIVSNFNPSYRRVGYYNELKKHIKIDTYGSAYGKGISNNQYVEIMKSCKFYLAFENSIHKDYITEKFFRALELGVVPVVLGPPRDDYEIHAPGNSFIHVDDFTSPKELAEKLKHLDQNPDEYMGYFEWRNRFRSVDGRFAQDNACNTCQYLKKHKRYHHFRNLNKWWWV